MIKNVQKMQIYIEYTKNNEHFWSLYYRQMIKYGYNRIHKERGP